MFFNKRVSQYKDSYIDFKYLRIRFKKYDNLPELNLKNDLFIGFLMLSIAGLVLLKKR